VSPSARLSSAGTGTLRPARPTLLKAPPTAEELADERRAGWEAGWAEGFDAGRAEAERQAAEERAQADASLERALVALREATMRAAAAWEQTQEELEALAVELGLAIAEAVVGRELTEATSLGAEALRRALAEGRPRPGAIVRLNPEDLAELPEWAKKQAEGLELVGDAELARGDAVVETAEATLDARISAQLARARAMLRGEA